MNNENIITKTLSIDGMTCSHCNESVEATFKRINGIVDAKADYIAGKAMVQYFEGKTEVEEIIEAFNKLSHYRASLVEKELS